MQPPVTGAATGYASALLDMLDGVLGHDGDSYRRCARSMEDVAGEGAMSGDMTFYASLYAALCYDIAGMQADAARMYGTLPSRYGGEFDYMLPSGACTGDLVEGIAALGRRDADVLSSALSGIAGLIRGRESAAGRPPAHGSYDDCAALMATLILVCEFFSSVHDDAGRPHSLALDASRMRDELSRFDVSPTLRIMAILCLDLIRASEERSGGSPAAQHAPPK